MKQLGTFDFLGTLKCMAPPIKDGRIQGYAVPVSVVCSDRTHLREPGGYRLSTQTDHGGYISTGFKVIGFAEDVDVPHAKWLFHMDDVALLTRGTSEAASVKPEAATPSATPTTPEPQEKPVTAEVVAVPANVKRWTTAFIAYVKAYRDEHGTKKTAVHFGVSEALIRHKLPRDKPQTMGLGVYTHRTK